MRKFIQSIKNAFIVDGLFMICNNEIRFGIGMIIYNFIFLLVNIDNLKFYTK